VEAATTSATKIIVTVQATPPAPSQRPPLRSASHPHSGWLIALIN
jgi:hypothetical protein